jgi:hypothetical protein
MNFAPTVRIERRDRDSAHANFPLVDAINFLHEIVGHRNLGRVESEFDRVFGPKIPMSMVVVVMAPKIA